MTQILSEKDLNLFLKILAEESVKKAYETELTSLFELNDKEEDPLFGGDDKDEEDKGKNSANDDGDKDALAAMSADVGGGDSAEDTTKDEPKSDQKKKVEIRPTPLTLELGEVTSDGLLATLNMIRAGRSFKEPDVSAQMKKYFEKQLNDSEKLALATFLSAIRDLTSGKPAEDVSEPGDENVHIDATSGRGEEKQQSQGQQSQSEPQQSQQPQVNPRPQSMSRGSEDTSPPIQVGPRNSSLAESYREHIRSLLVN